MTTAVCILYSQVHKTSSRERGSNMQKGRSESQPKMIGPMGVLPAATYAGEKDRLLTIKKTLETSETSHRPTTGVWIRWLQSENKHTYMYDGTQRRRRWHHRGPGQFDVHISTFQYVASYSWIKVRQNASIGNFWSLSFAVPSAPSEEVEALQLYSIYFRCFHLGPRHFLFCSSVFFSLFAIFHIGTPGKAIQFSQL